MAVVEDEVQKLWQLLVELSCQLTQNREQSALLKKQADDLKTQAIHTATGYVLKRFNVDLSQEQFESELERMNAQLVIENQTLQHENRQLAVLLKDHENTLEQIMTRFRSHAHSTQQHELELTKYYESVILSILENKNQSANHASHDESHQFNKLDPDSFQIIQSISTLIQKAIRELSGEEPELNESNSIENQQDELNVSDSATHQSTSPTDLHHYDQQDPSRLGLSVKFEDPFKPTQITEGGSNENVRKTDLRRKSTSVIDYRPRIRDPSSGGYVGKRKGSLSDYALLSAIESERLRRENDYLREMLGIANDFSFQPTGTNSTTKFGNLDHQMDDESNSSANYHNQVVNQVIKEEEDDEEDEEEEQQQPLTDDLSNPNHPSAFNNLTHQTDHQSSNWPENLQNDLDHLPQDHPSEFRRPDLILGTHHS